MAIILIFCHDFTQKSYLIESYDISGRPLLHGLSQNPHYSLDSNDLLPCLPADEGHPKLKAPVFSTHSSDKGYRKIHVLNRINFITILS